MEEVFIKVGENSIEEVVHARSGSINEPLLENSNLTYDSIITGYLLVKFYKYIIFSPLIDLNTGIALWFQQFYALLVKRFLHSLRNWHAIITQIIIPIIFIILGLVLIETVPGTTSHDEKRPLSMAESALIEDRIMMFYAELDSNNTIFKVSWFNK